MRVHTGIVAILFCVWAAPAQAEQVHPKQAHAGQGDVEEPDSDSSEPAEYMSRAPNQLLSRPTFGPRLKLSAAIKSNLNQYTNEAAYQLGAMTMGMLDMRFDLQSKRGRVHLGGGDPDLFRLHIDSKVIVGRGRARVQARVDLAIAGVRWELEVPDVDLDTESVSGERAVTFTLPLLEGAF